MGAPRIQLAVRDTSAARMLDMSATDFRRLVQRGVFPPPVRLESGLERWRVSDIEAILSGKAAFPDEDIEL